MGLFFYNKYRPTCFDEMRGQDHVKKSLSRQVEKDQLVHAYLFTGPAGCGKTTCARILASMINCSTGPTTKPPKDDHFASAIMSGKSMVDVYEMDAATNNGIDKIRDLRDKAHFAPVEMRKKIYIIDECHRLTSQAWEGLLKIVEEPPETVMFIFCTTEPNAVKQTIKTRSMIFDFRPLSIPDVIAEIKRVAAAEEMQMDEDAIRALATASKGSLRQALNWLDKLRSGERITSSTVSDEIGIVDRVLIRDFILAIVSPKGGLVDSEVASSACLRRGVTGTDFIRGVADYCCDLMKHGARDYNMEQYGYSKEEIEDLARIKEIVKNNGIGEYRTLFEKWIMMAQSGIELSVFEHHQQNQVNVTYMRMHRTYREMTPKKSGQPQSHKDNCGLPT